MVSSDATVKTCLAMYSATEFFPMYSLVYTSTGTTIIIIVICYTRNYFFMITITELCPTLNYLVISIFHGIFSTFHCLLHLFLTCTIKKYNPFLLYNYSNKRSSFFFIYRHYIIPFSLIS
jgi:hypothetical protein